VSVEVNQQEPAFDTFAKKIKSLAIAPDNFLGLAVYAPSIHL
jgi:hypothetical protein